MLSLLNASVAEYLKENVVLTVVLALILVLIAVLSGIMIYLQVKAKKNGGAEETAQKNAETAAEEAKEAEAAAEEQTDSPAEAEEEPTVEPAAETAEEQTKSASPEEIAEESFEVKEDTPAKPAEKKEAKPEVKKTAPVKPAEKKEPKPETKAEEKKDQEEKPIGFQDGKWIIRKTEEGKFSFKLYAANGGIMLESSKEYSSLSNAKKGIETYKKSFSDNNCKIIATKNGHFVYRLLNANGMLIAVSTNYTSKSSCENALDSTKRYALNAPLEILS